MMFKKNPCLAAAIFFLCLATGCRTVPPLPKIDLSDPAWTAHTGQAVWRQNRNSPDIAGEIIVATTSNRAYVQFSKPPFPIVSAQITTNSWQIDSSTANKTFSGRGTPPRDVLWLQLARAMMNLELPADWSWTSTGQNWQISNRSTGESLEGYFAP